MPHRHLLMIDDEEHIREVASLSLETTEEWTVATASSGSAGILLALSSRPDAILLDVMMPDMDGPTTLRVLQAHEETRSIPVIFLTAKVQAVDRRNFLNMGVQGIIAKPFDPMTLGQQIRSALAWE